MNTMILFRGYTKLIQAGIVTMLMIGMGSVLLSCATVKEPHSSSRVLDEDDIKNISVGMSIDEVFHYCGPLILFDVPILQYLAKNGEYYVFYFLPTKEVNRPVSAQDNELVLVAVTRKDSKTGEEYYLLPDSVKGDAFTGIKEPDEWE